MDRPRGPKKDTHLSIIHSTILIDLLDYFVEYICTYTSQRPDDVKQFFRFQLHTQTINSIYTNS